MKGKWLYCLGILLFVIGMGVLLYPQIHIFLQEKDTKQSIKQFESERKQANQAAYEEMQQYNASLYQKGQADLHDAWNTKTDTRTNTVIGIVKIPKMQLEVPLYKGASEENLSKGVAVLDQTSMPIGGKNTNCVIAGHRGGYHGEAMFKDIELLKQGDSIYLTNPWNTLEYSVKKMEVIYPNEIAKVAIQTGKDMITLITCHPYPSNTQRYIVYAERKKGNTQAGTAVEDHQLSASEKRIQRERQIHTLCLYGAGILCILGVVYVLKQKKAKR